jgi:hypothetical protein
LHRYRAKHPDFTFCIITPPWVTTSANTLVVAKRAPQPMPVPAPRLSQGLFREVRTGLTSREADA